MERTLVYSLLRSLTVWKMAIAFVPDFALGRDNLSSSSSSGYVVKVIINKSCGEVSPIEQDTVDCEYSAYFSPK